MQQFDLNERGGWIVPAYTELAPGTVVPAFSEFGDGCQLGNGCRLGDGCQLGNGCRLEGVAVLQWLTLANVDGTGRQILVIRHAEGIRVRAGCFVGTDAEFLAKAGAEGKARYVAILGAVLEGLRACE